MKSAVGDCLGQMLSQQQENVQNIQVRGGRLSRGMQEAGRCLNSRAGITCFCLQHIDISPHHRKLLDLIGPSGHLGPRLLCVRILFFILRYLCSFCVHRAPETSSTCPLARSLAVNLLVGSLPYSHMGSRNNMFLILVRGWEEKFPQNAWSTCRGLGHLRSQIKPLQKMSGKCPVFLSCCWKVCRTGCETDIRFLLCVGNSMNVWKIHFWKGVWVREGTVWRRRKEGTGGETKSETGRTGIEMERVPWIVPHAEFVMDCYCMEHSSCSWQTESNPKNHCGFHTADCAINNTQWQKTTLLSLVEVFFKYIVFFITSMFQVHKDFLLLTIVYWLWVGHPPPSTETPEHYGLQPSIHLVNQY